MQDWTIRFQQYSAACSIQSRVLDAFVLQKSQLGLNFEFQCPFISHVLITLLIFSSFCNTSHHYFPVLWPRDQRSRDSRVLEFILLRSQSRDLDTKVSRAEWRGVIHSMMQQKLKNRIHIVGCGSMDMDNSLNSLLAISKRMYCFIGFQL